MSVSFLFCVWGLWEPRFGFRGLFLTPIGCMRCLLDPSMCVPGPRNVVRTALQPTAPACLPACSPSQKLVERAFGGRPISEVRERGSGDWLTDKEVAGVAPCHPLIHIDGSAKDQLFDVTPKSMQGNRGF